MRFNCGAAAGAFFKKLIRFEYAAFGLGICSDFECPELRVDTGSLDVLFRLGDVPPISVAGGAAGGVLQASPGRCQLKIAGVARYLVSNGAEIVVDPVPSADADAMRLFLFGSAMGALIHQRRLLPLHASSILTSRGAVVFAGISGAGKSTLAAAFRQKGFRTLADDLCVIDAAHSPAVLPGTTGLLMWADALLELGISATGLRPVRPGLRKYFLPARDNLPSEPVPLHAVYIMQTARANVVQISPIVGFKKLSELTANTFRKSYVEPMGLAESHFKQVGRVAAGTSMKRLVRPRDGFRLEHLVDLLLEDFEG